MEVHSPMIAKRLWNILRITLFIIRKGLVSKRKLLIDMNLMMKKGKLLRRSLSNLRPSRHHHHLHSKNTLHGSFGLQEYEFSCSNSPNPVFFHVQKRKNHFRFLCINPPHVTEEEEQEQEQDRKVVTLVTKTPEHSLNFRFDGSNFAPGEKKSPLLSPFSVRISNFSSEDGSEESGNGQVDDQAEEFITRFYEQLRAQRHTQLVEYQEMQ